MTNHNTCPANMSNQSSSEMLSWVFGKCLTLNRHLPQEYGRESDRKLVMPHFYEDINPRDVHFYGLRFVKVMEVMIESL